MNSTGEQSSIDWLDRFSKSQSSSTTKLIERLDGNNVETSGPELHRQASDIAKAVASKTKVGDVVALIQPAGAYWVAQFLGILRAGCIALPINPDSTDGELEKLIRMAAPTGFVSQVDGMSARVGSLGHITADSNGDDLGDRARPIEDVALLIPTSGTTGAPKGVALTFASVAYMVDRLSGVQKPVSTDAWVSVLPLNHMLELGCSLLPVLGAGGRFCFAPSLVPHELIEFMTSVGATRMMTVPVILGMLRRRIEAGALQLPSSLHTLYCGGAALDVETVEFFEALGTGLYAGYGMTETSPTIAVNHPAANRPGSVGRPLDGTEVRIVNDEIQVRGPSVMSGYWNDSLTTATSFDGGWLRTGDLGHLDGDGFLYVTGRAKNLIVLLTGKKVQPEEVEDAITGSELINEVCVSGVSEVCAVLVPTDATTPLDRLHEEVAGRCAGISPYKRPSRIIVVEAIPKSQKQAVDRKAVLGIVESR